MSVQTFLRIDDVVRLTGMPRSTIYYHAKRGDFPKPCRISAGRSAWLESEIVEWQRQRVAERDCGQDVA